MADDTSFTVFEGFKRLAGGDLAEVTLAVKAAEEHGVESPVLVFDDTTGRVVDVDTRGNPEEIIARLAGAAASSSPESAPRGRGRPKLGVTGREVTLLPRHWEWLNRQPGGASVALRKLVEAARRGDQANHVEARDAAYRFMSALAGDLPGFEEASRALFAGERGDFDARIEGWPTDVRDHCRRMSTRAFPKTAAESARERVRT